METIHVRLKARRQDAYDVTIEPGLFDHLPDIMAADAGQGETFVITDANVHRLYGRRLLHACEQRGLHVSMFVVPAGEASKNRGLVADLQSELLRRGIQRDSLVVAFGGGVVGDLAGFVAATVLRGVPYLQIPTTLLSQVDSSVGGKVGIDHEIGKNLIGAFYQPVDVLIDPVFLKTLDARQYAGGLAEVLKIALALDREFVTILKRHAKAVLRRDPKVLEQVIGRAVGLKATIVERDEFETGVRKSLNLGHTIGHAIEAATGYKLIHGECVAIGTAIESEIAVSLGLMRPKDRTTLLALLKMFRLPVQQPRTIDRARFFSALAADKKGKGGRPTFSLPAGIGSTAIGVPVPDHVINNVMHFKG